MENHTASLKFSPNTAKYTRKLAIQLATYGVASIISQGTAQSTNQARARLFNAARHANVKITTRAQGSVVHAQVVVES